MSGGDNNYTLINGVKQTAMSYNKYEIQFQNNDNTTKTDVTNLLTIEDKKYCFENPLLFALFKEFNPDINSKTNITNNLNTSFSNNIVIKVDKFGSGAKTEDVSFGFVEPTVDDNPPANVIFLHSSLFNQVDNDEVKKYALVLLERYYNDNNNSNNREKIKTLCKEVKQSGGNPIKDSTRSRTLTRKRKRKIPKK